MDMAVGVIIGGAFTAIVNSLLIALVIFMLIKTLNKFSKKKEEAPAPVTTKECPYCKQTIAQAATRCPHCTSELEA